MSARLKQYVRHLQDSRDEEPFIQHRDHLIRRDRFLGIALTVSLVLFAILFVLYFWFLFTVYPQDTTAWVQKEKQSHGDESSQLVNELIELATRTNFSSFEEKGEFLEKELNKKLEKYRKSRRDVPSFKYANVSLLPNGDEIVRRFALFIRVYNDFSRRVHEAEALHNQILEQTGRYDSLLDQLEIEKTTWLALVKEKDRLAKEKEKVDQEIQEVKNRINNSPGAKDGELTAELRLIQQKKKEKEEANCGELAKKMEQIKSKQEELNNEIQRTLAKIVEIDMQKVQLQDNILHLKWLVQSKQGQLEVSETDYKSVENLQNLLKETRQLQDNENLILPVRSALNILRKSYQILTDPPGDQTDAERKQMKRSYLLTVKHLKQQIHVLHQENLNSEKLALEASLSGRESLDHLETKIEKLKDELASKKNDIENAKTKLENYVLERDALEQESRKIKADSNKLDKQRETEAAINKNCTKILQQLEEYEKAYAKKERELTQSMEDLKERLKEKQDIGHTQSAQLKVTNSKILKSQRVFKDVLDNLTQNFNKLEHRKVIFAEKDHEMNRTYHDLIKYKREFIEILTRIELPEL